MKRKTEKREKEREERNPATITRGLARRKKRNTV